MGCDAFLFNYTEKSSIFLGRWHYYNNIEISNSLCKELSQRQVLKMFTTIYDSLKGVRGIGPLRQFIKNVLKEIKSQDVNSKYILLHDYLPEIPYNYCFQLFEGFKELDIR
jgi:hypothetical protein